MTQNLPLQEAIPRLFMRKNVKEWNNTAIDCYNLNCNCEKCFIHNTYFKDKYYSCKMKYYVKLLLEKLGEPPAPTYEEKAS